MKHLSARLLARPGLIAALLLASATLASAQYSTPIRDVDEPARNRFKIESVCVGTANCTTSQSVPAGYIFVIETVIFRLPFDAMAELTPGPIATSQSVYLPPTHSTPVASIGVLSLRLYSDGQPGLASK